MFLAKTDRWYMERTIPLLAGIFTIVSLWLGILVSPYWFILTGLVGVNQMILSLTGFCPMTILLDRLGCKSRITQ